MNPHEVAIHALAAVEPGARIGPRSRIWQFCVILPGAVIGEDCNICAHCLIEGGVTVGSRVTLKSGVQLWEGITLEDDVFVGPNVSFTNDPYPRSQKHPGDREYSKTMVRQGASIGANATVLPGITIGPCAMIGAGAVVTHDVPAFAQVFGNPARLWAWVCRCGKKLVFDFQGFAVCACGVRFKKGPADQVKEVIA